jgi:hypothetical protein
VRISEDLWRAIESICSSEEYRNKAARKLAHNIRKLTTECVTMDIEVQRLYADAKESKAREEDKHDAASELRAKHLHSLRCIRLADLAQQMSLLMRVALGDTVIDETTAGCGITTEERALIWTIASAK